MAEAPSAEGVTVKVGADEGSVVALEAVDHGPAPRLLTPRCRQ